MSDQKKKKISLTSDWSKNWHGSISIKITAVILWTLMLSCFLFSIPYVNSLHNNIMYQYHADMLELEYELTSKLEKISDPQIIAVITQQFLNNINFENKYKSMHAAKVDVNDQSFFIGQTKDDQVQLKHSIKIAENLFSLTSYHLSQEDYLSQKKIQIGSLIVGFTVLFGGFLLLVVNNILNTPFSLLVDATHAITAGNVNFRLDDKREDEFGEVSNCLNHMLDQLSKQQNDLLDANKHLKEEIKFKDEALLSNKQKSSFLANMSHEIRTPLTAILGYSDSLLDSPAQDNETKLNAIKRISHNGHHLLSIINDILDLSKIEADKLEIESIIFSPIELSKDIAKLLEIKAQEHNNQIKFDYIFPLPDTIELDPVRVKQIILNLAGNALRFTTNGTISLGIALTEDHHNIIFSVTDTGIGMTEEQTKNIFKPYKQASKETSRRYGGTGLGLTISQRLTELMNGKIKVQSTLTVGSRFEVFFPINTADLQLVDSEPDEHTSESTQTKSLNYVLTGSILVADDTPDNLELIKYYLEKYPLQLEFANNGKECIEKAQNGNFDLILMDMHMPVMNGTEATKYLRKENFDIPILALTAAALKDEQQKFLECGCNTILTKPIEIDQFIKTLHKYLTIKHENYLPAQSTIDDAEYISPKPPKKIEELEAKFNASLPDYARRIRNSLKLKKWNEINEIVHKLRGLGGNLGHHQLTELCGESEQLISQNNYKKATFSLNTILKYIENKKNT